MDFWATFLPVKNKKIQVASSLKKMRVFSTSSARQIWILWRIQNWWNQIKSRFTPPHRSIQGDRRQPKKKHKNGFRKKRDCTWVPWYVFADLSVSSRELVVRNEKMSWSLSLSKQEKTNHFLTIFPWASRVGSKPPFWSKHQESAFSQPNNSRKGGQPRQLQNAKQGPILVPLPCPPTCRWHPSVGQNRVTWVKWCSDLHKRNHEEKKRAMIYAERYLLRLVCVCVQHALFIIWFLKEERPSRIPWVNVQGIQPLIPWNKIREHQEIPGETFLFRPHYPRRITNYLGGGF